MDAGDTTCYIWLDQENFYNTQIDYNVIYGAKIGGVGLSANDISQDPMVVDDNLETFDGHLKTGSPAIDSGLATESLGGLIPDHDLEGNDRPQGAGVDRGAYEFLSTPCPACSGDIVVFENVTFTSDATCQCTAATSITIGAGVTIQKGATVTFKAPTVKLQNGLHAEEGAVVHIK